MNCLNGGNYKKLSESEEREETETNVDEASLHSNANANASQEANASDDSQRYEYRSDGKTRILPIVRSGEKQSDTHYFVIPPPVVRVPVASNQPVHRSHSPSPCQVPLELVQRVTASVHGVTDDEARLALELARLDLRQACNYLAVEQLFRLGFPRDQATRALNAAEGNLEKASAALLAARLGHTHGNSSHSASQN